MADRNTPKDGYTQLNLIDMFRRARSNGSGSSPGRRGRQDSDDQHDSEAPGNRGGRSSRGSSHSSSRHSNSPGSRPGGSSRRPYRHHHHGNREGNRDRDRDRERRHGQGRRLGGNAARREEEEQEEGESTTSDSMDIEMGKDVPLPQGTSSMLRADPGRGDSLRKMNMAHSHLIVAECPQISQAIFGKKALGFLYNALDIEPLEPQYCPAYRLPPEDPEAGKIGCRIRVVNQDTFACAEEMIKRHNYEQSQMEIARKQGNTEPDMHPVDNGVVCLNMANAKSKGGGFHHGSVAQEEVLMHRSTLYDTLDPAFYPWTDTEAVYSPWVAIYKKYNPPAPEAPGGSYTPLERAQAILSSGVAITDANKLGMPGPPLPELAVISIAAIPNPATVVRRGKTEYAHPYVEDLMQMKIRQLLRIAGLNGHRRLVLGALGCGAFANPKQTVAEMFLSVLKEQEFQGGWWKEITFACFDRDTSPGSNPYIFGQVLDGVVV